ncbi:Ribosome biogenesis protein YTM1 [Moelleriella libera RCEF 2490]|uniref:Ribosome biogenesis protein YTM1 n=1 Tax=Moelleriella libera RCEF 2490 TaxID=1081109 RepID=A0A167XEG1_9HYPO|nr:Ribosome biogenesis protein YTM1 [Moelleriella libera RCEF 2490]
MAASPAQVKVVFTTDEEDLQLPEARRQLLVPAGKQTAQLASYTCFRGSHSPDIKRYGLSRILNSESMLDTSSPTPLDFIVDGAFLRTSIEDYLKANGLSSETTLTLKYVRSLIPPVYRASFQHDDWVGAVDVLSSSAPAAKGIHGTVNDRVASAGYDGLVRIWNPSGDIIATSAPTGYPPRLNSVRWVSPTKLVSAGLQGEVVVWSYSEASHGTSGSFKCDMKLVGHEKQIHNLDVNSLTKRVLSASSDGCVGLWSSSKDAAPKVDAADSSEPKRTKLAASATFAERGPLAMMPMHDSQVMAAVFHAHDSTVAYSASQDGTVKTIDLTTQRQVSSLTTKHPVVCAAALRNSLIAAGSSAKHIALLDPRESAATTAAMTLHGHTNWVVSVSQSPSDDFSLVSGSWDSTCRVWDLRSAKRATNDVDGVVGKPVYTIGRNWLKGQLPAAGHGAKVLSVVWDKAWGIVSAGEDKTVQVNSARDILAQ